MIYRESDVIQSRAISVSNGTLAASEFRLDGENTMVAAEAASMYSLRTSVDKASFERRSWHERHIRAAVLTSLERSLTENAEVWAELSKY